MKTRAKRIKRILRFFRGTEFITESLRDLVETSLPVLMVAALPLLLALVWYAPLWAVSYHQTHIPLKLTPKDLLDFEGNVRTTLVQLLGGIAVLIGSYIAYRNVKAVEKNIKVSQEGQINERFTRAVEQLGSEILPVRLGGISSLESIAHDSERHHRAVMETLSNYVRSHRRISESTAEAKDDPADNEVQAIFTVIGRRAWVHEIDGHGLDFRGLDLHDLNLQTAFLEGLSFDNSNLNGVNFVGAALEEASFVNASLDWAQLQGLDLSGVDFRATRLAKANLSGCKLKGACNLTASQVSATYFDKATSMTALMKEELKRIWKFENENCPPQLQDTQQAEVLGIAPVASGPKP